MTMLLTERERRIEVAEALRELLAVVNSQRPLDEVLDYVLERAIELLASDAGLVYMTGPDPNDGFLRIGAARGLSPDRVATRLRIGSPVSGLAVQRRRPVAFVDLGQVLSAEVGAEADAIVDDLGSHLVVRRIANLLSEPSTLESLNRLAVTHPAALAVPLVARHETYGALTLFYCQPRPFSDQDVELASAFADQAALVIENASLRDAAERRASELEALYRADEQIYRSLRLDEVFNALVGVATDLLGPDKAAVGILDESGERVVVGAARGYSATTLAQSLSAAQAQQLRAHLESGVVVIEDVHTDPRLPASVRAADEREGIQSSMTAPIRIGDEIIGAFRLAYCQQRTFGQGEQRLLLALAQRAGLAIQNARLFEQAQYAATLEERQRLAREVAEELRASRQRIVAAQDAERRRIEQDIHDGAQQELIALAVNIRVAQELIMTNPAEGSGLLADVAEQLGAALANLRDLARGIFPAVLADRGLVAALEAQLIRVPARAQLVADPALATVRFAPEVEAAAYFCCLEALQNCAKHASGAPAQVRLTLDDAWLAFSVSDSGPGFDLSVARDGTGLHGMADRLAAIGGTLEVRSQPGQGTVVSGRLPAARSAHVPA